MLFDEYNDVHIFVEDFGFENLYKVLFKKHGLNVAKIFSKNGKAEVLAAAEICNDKKCVYLVDRDWDDLHESMPTLSNIVVLDKYSIENYVIDYDAFLGIILGEIPKFDIASNFSRIDFQNILTDLSNTLRPLFICFASMQQSENRERSCSITPGHFQVGNRTCAPDDAKIAEFTSNSTATITPEITDYFKDELLLDKGHGKYMLHFSWLAVKLKAGINTGLNPDKLLMRLALLVDTDGLAEIAQSVKNVYAS